jgi:hypothetical protein
LSVAVLGLCRKSSSTQNAWKLFTAVCRVHRRLHALTCHFHLYLLLSRHPAKLGHNNRSRHLNRYSSRQEGSFTATSGHCSLAQYQGDHDFRTLEHDHIHTKVFQSPKLSISTTTAAAAFGEINSITMFGPTDGMLQNQQRMYYNTLKQHIEGM